MWIIYMVTNKLNGKRYIGVTAKGLSARQKKHLVNARRGYRGSPRLCWAIRKYGEENFTWEIVATYSIKEEALRDEYTLVRDLAPEYNVAEGGNVRAYSSGWNSRKVICLNDGLVYESASAAAAAYGADNSEVSKSCKGTGIAVKRMYFRYHTTPLSKEERTILIAHDKQKAIERQRRTATRKSNSIKGTPRPGKQVICLDDGTIFESASATARYYDVNRSAVIEMCNGKKPWYVGGKHFAYVEHLGQRWFA